MNKSFIISQFNIKKKWYIINSKNQIFGRLLSQISYYLLNKNLKFYTPFLFPINKIILINSETITLSKKKKLKNRYINYSGYPNGLTFKTFLTIKIKNIKKLILLALLKMIPKNKLKKKILASIYIFKTINNIHHAQLPKFIQII